MALHAWKTHWLRRVHRWWRVLRRQNVVPELDAGTTVFDIRPPQARAVLDDAHHEAPTAGTRRAPTLRRFGSGHRKLPARATHAGHEGASRRQRA